MLVDERPLVDDGPVDERAGDGTTAGETGPVGLDLARLAHVESDLASVEQAMERLDAGTWGTCRHCGEALPQVTLEADPTAASCAEHA
jgi:RNA polymerase-binding transcription factor DksA